LPWWQVSPWRGCNKQGRTTNLIYLSSIGINTGLLWVETHNAK
jgi:hypothetical protein